MVTSGFYLIVAVALTMFFAMVYNPRAVGWWLAAVGLLFLAHAGVSIAIIAANDNVVPVWVDYWLLFATVPVGVLLITLGITIV
jgi:hypothetical protein